MVVAELADLKTALAWLKVNVGEVKGLGTDDTIWVVLEDQLFVRVRITSDDPSRSSC